MYHINLHRNSIYLIITINFPRLRIIVVKETIILLTNITKTRTAQHQSGSQDEGGWQLGGRTHYSALHNHPP